MAFICSYPFARTGSQAEAANGWLAFRALPLMHPVDGVDQWATILAGAAASPSSSISASPSVGAAAASAAAPEAPARVLHLSSKAVLRWPHKLVVGLQPFGSAWTPPLFPDCGTRTTLTDRKGPMFGDVHVAG